MTKLHADDLREKTDEQLQNMLEEQKTRLAKETGLSKASFQQPDNPGAINELKKNVARIKTVLNQR